MNLRDRIETAFDAWGRFTYRRRWVLIFLMIAVGGGLATQMARIEFDNSVEAFLHPDDPIRLAYDEFREQFGSDELVIIAVRPPDVFDIASLRRLRVLHEELRRDVPYVEKITSLVNARFTRGEGDELIVEELMGDGPLTPGAVATLEERVKANPLYLNTLVSEDGRLTTVSIELSTYSPASVSGTDLAGFEEAEGGESTFLSDVEEGEALQAIRRVVERHDSADFRLYVAGGPCLRNRLDTAMSRDVVVFMLLGVVVAGFFLFALFRRVSAVLLPLFAAGLALAATFGLMGMIRIPLSTVTQILPAFLLVVSVCDSVHFMVIFYQRRAAGDGREDAIAFTLAHSGLAILMTSLTTAGGLASFAAAELAPVTHVGVLAPIGVMLAFVYTVTLLPALVAVNPLRDRGETGGKVTPRVLNRALRWFGDVSTRHPWKIVAVTVALFAVSLTGVAKLRFSHSPLLWFPESEPIRVATMMLDHELRGSLTAEMVLRSGRENEMQRPERLNELEAIKRHAESFEYGELFVGKAITLADIVKETHQALNGNDPRSYVVPQAPELVAQELLLFESSAPDDMERIVDSRFTTTRVSMKVPYGDATLTPGFVAQLEKDVGEIVGDGVEIETTGVTALLGRSFSQVIVSMARSYAIALAIITPLMILLIGNLRRGILSMPPNLAPIVLVLGVMGWLGIPLDAATLMIGGIILGLAVDDTIHFMHNFTRYYSRTGDARGSVHLTLQTSGSAMLVTSLVLTAGFIIFTAGYLVNVAYFGVLCALSAIVAFIADVLLAPALMVLITRWEQRRAAAG